MRLRVKKCIHLMVILLALIETFTGAVIDCVVYTILYSTSLEYDGSSTTFCYFTAHLLPTKHFYRLIIVLYVPILYLWRSHGAGRISEGSSGVPENSVHGQWRVLGVIYARFPRRILPTTAGWIWQWLRVLQCTNASVSDSNNSTGDYNLGWLKKSTGAWRENRKLLGELVNSRSQEQQLNSVIKQYNTRVCRIYFCACFHDSLTSVACLLSFTQGSQASWKVLDFFLENSRTWKVLEKYP